MQDGRGKDLFQQWVDATPLPEIESQGAKFRDEGIAHHVMQAEKMKNYLEFNAKQKTKITAGELALQDMLSSVTGITAKLAILLMRKLALLTQ
jgi:hypothetical protein